MLKRLSAALFLASTLAATAQEGIKLQPAAAAANVKDVASLEPSDVATLKPGTILFTDYREKASANPESGLIAYADWLKTRPVEAAALAPYPGYAEPDYSVTLNGVTKQRHETLKVYVAEGRFVVAKPPGAIDLSRYATLDFVSKMDGAIRHKALNPAEVTPTKDPAAAFARRPDRPWCEAANTVCLESRYDLEGKLPLGVKLANKLELGSTKKVAEFVSFQSELRLLSAGEAAGLGTLTRIETPVAGGLEQTIFWVNQILRFGKFLAVVQPAPNDPGKSVVTTYMALAVKADVLDRKQEYARVPVLKNLLPVQVLMGNSSFNTGTSISAGLPTYARNRLSAFAEAVAKN
ncbi:hypothetical protein GCM10007887_12470 [Methylobacterium haplocladii]|uniref:Lipoprotein n=1 Tax=Methylobacterium haplocladii TaxID=1176176 RepID=A0A512IPI0_9HYPH|nr:hypothetical protein [Methylobacterium haplocladii]GEO99607.1 hypothetical protein MHA02_19950 [Methylobacterium haplocladii]GJD85898.1 hypothetical protein HPGCJGGD_3793 [Methylobacterium haplocladii]GLS58583.1 hypothetical protein GCM10007887_12470 [Methylobacterium haplocladii]